MQVNFTTDCSTLWKSTNIILTSSRNGKYKTIKMRIIQGRDERRLCRVLCCDKIKDDKPTIHTTYLSSLFKDFLTTEQCIDPIVRSFFETTRSGT